MLPGFTLRNTLVRNALGNLDDRGSGASVGSAEGQVWAWDRSRLASGSGGPRGGDGDASLPQTTTVLDHLPLALAAREVGHSAIFSVSSAKAGHGVQCLRDGALDTYWQSDGVLPHFVSLSFTRREIVTGLALYVDVHTDDSYTPARLRVSGSAGAGDVHDEVTEEVSMPVGWIYLPLPDWRVRALQLSIFMNHENGRDSNIRQLKVFGARPPSAQPVLPPLTHSTMTAFTALR
uniref:DOC domain-containing protein n=1 Tax=Sexangularia sp. CB-2014 TaxID=1486929 RepID=A0A7S1YAW7_9EUKA